MNTQETSERKKGTERGFIAFQKRNSRNDFFIFIHNEPPFSILLFPFSKPKLTSRTHIEEKQKTIEKSERTVQSGGIGYILSTRVCFGGIVHRLVSKEGKEPKATVNTTSASMIINISLLFVVVSPGYKAGSWHRAPCPRNCSADRRSRMGL